MASQQFSAGATLAAAADPRKTITIADENRSRTENAVQVSDAATAKAILRSKCVRQAGFGSERLIRSGMLANPPVIMLDGEPHRRQRAATARFFSPTIVSSQYADLMEATAAELIERFMADGQANLEDLSMELAVAIASEIVGLTESDRGGLTRRMNAFFRNGNVPGEGRLSRLKEHVRNTFNRILFMTNDVYPAIRSRKREPKFDVLSHLISEGYNYREILAECLTYGIAGMITTREFIVIAFWQMMEQPVLAARFLAEDQRGQILIMEEILRTEPIVGVLSRRAAEDIELPADPPVTLPAGTLFEIDVRQVNADEAAVGQCPHAIDPDRASAQKTGGSVLSFGDGVHRCPGSQVALYETAIFLNRLLRVPGLRLVSSPQLSWQQVIEGFEVSNVVIRCDRPEAAAA